jgi:hypothetical protein
MRNRSDRWSLAAAFGVLVVHLGCGASTAPDSPATSGSSMRDANGCLVDKAAEGWSAPQRLGQAGLASGKPASEDGGSVGVAVDACGNALAVWATATGSTGVFAARFLVGTGWTAAEQIDAGLPPPDEWQLPAVSMSAGGNALVVWSTAAGLWSNHLAGATSRWDGARFLAQGRDVKLAVDAAEHWTALWISRDHTRVVRSAVFSPASGWEAAQDIAQHGDDTQLSVNGGGAKVAVWCETYGGVETSRFTPGAGWGPLEWVTPDDENFYPNVGLDAAGNAIAVWTDLNGVRTYRVGPGQPWNRDAPYLRKLDTYTEPRLAVTSGGEAIAAWFDHSPGAWASHFTPASGWETAQLISGPMKGDLVQVGLDASGSGLAAWRQSNEKQNLWASTFTRGSGWGPPVLLQADTSQASYGGAHVAVGASGAAVATWPESDGAQLTVWARRWVPSR